MNTVDSIDATVWAAGVPPDQQGPALMAMLKGKGDPTAPVPWEPLPRDDRPRALPFPLDVLPMPLASFARETAESLRAPVDFVAASMIATAGAAIGQSVNIRIKRGWHEPPLFYMVLVGEPGSGKTPSQHAAVKPLARINERLRAESLDARKMWEAAKKAHERDKNAPPPGPEPPQLRATVDDITRESLCVVLADNPRGVMCDPDELTAWFNSWGQYTKSGTDRPFWLKMWTTHAVGVDRKGGRESLYVPHPFCAVLGGVQPDLLACLKSDQDDGFTDRLAFVFPDEFPSRCWTNAEISPEAYQDWAGVVGRLHDVPMRPDSDHPRPWIASLTPAAEALYIAWFNANGAAMDDPKASDGRHGAMSKACGLVARLALTLSRMRLACDPTQPLFDDVRGVVPPIEVCDVDGAIQLAAYLENHRERAVGRMTGKRAGGDADAVIAWVKRRGRPTFRASDVPKDLRRFRDTVNPDGPALLAAAIAALEGGGRIRRIPETALPGKRGPKPAPSYEVHPDLVSPAAIFA